MKILILSPLFPPDTAPSSQYVKELVTRLVYHKVTVLLYGHLPEEVQDVKYVCVDKRDSVLTRAFLFTKHLVNLARKHDLIIIQNGPSVELPSLITLWFIRLPVILMESDAPAMNRTLNYWLYGTIHRLIRRRALLTIRANDTSLWPLPRPQIHPLKPFPIEEMRLYEDSWQTHLKALQALLTSHHE